MRKVGGREVVEGQKRGVWNWAGPVPPEAENPWRLGMPPLDTPGIMETMIEDGRIFWRHRENPR